jgi:hypothetical protein
MFPFSFVVIAGSTGEICAQVAGKPARQAKQLVAVSWNNFFQRSLPKIGNHNNKNRKLILATVKKLTACVGGAQVNSVRTPGTKHSWPLLHSKDFSNPFFWSAFTLTGQW